MIINLKNNVGMIKSAKVGFSWTTLFFGIFVPLVRGDLKWAAIMLLVLICTLGFASIVFPFIYNKIYITGLIEKGFKPADDFSKMVLRQKGILI